jgi:transcriptional regulator NrdR family protein
MKCPWCQLVRDIRYIGVRDLQLTSKAGVDTEKVWSQVQQKFTTLEKVNGVKILQIAQFISEHYMAATWTVTENNVTYRRGVQP